MLDALIDFMIFRTFASFPFPRVMLSEWNLFIALNIQSSLFCGSAYSCIVLVLGFFWLFFVCVIYNQNLGFFFFRVGRESRVAFPNESQL